MSEHKLKPCPFCGGEAKRITLSEDEFCNDGGDVIECIGCGASSHVEFCRKENLTSHWNARHYSWAPTPAEAMRCPEVMALVEAMRRAIEAIDAAYDGSDDHGRYSTRERAALAALEKAARHE